MSLPRLAAALGSALTGLIAAPMVAHLTWRPLAVALGGRLEGVAFALSLAAVGVAAVAAALTAWRRGPVAWAVGLAVAVGAGLAVGGPAGGLSLLGVAASLLWALPPMQAALARVADPARPARPVALAIWCLMALGTTAASADVATYLGDAYAAGHGVGQGTYVYRHLCFTSYVHAAELLRDGAPNVYDLARIPAMYSGELPPTAAHMAPFVLDRYGYPPQFLLVPLAFLKVVPDFMALRALWTCLSALIFGWVAGASGCGWGRGAAQALQYMASIVWLLFNW
ncbi:MAG: hypothetical protein R3F43_30195 [bacterium]